MAGAQGTGERIERVGKLLFDFLHALLTLMHYVEIRDSRRECSGYRRGHGRPIRHERNRGRNRAEQQHAQSHPAHRPHQPRFGDAHLDDFDEIKPGQELVPDGDSAQQLLSKQQRGFDRQSGTSRAGA